MTPHAPLVDSFGRVHNNLRISVTDRAGEKTTAFEVPLHVARP